MFIVSNTDAARSKWHELSIQGTAYRWSGPYSYFDM
jgi:hypothetical protein